MEPCVNNLFSILATSMAASGFYFKKMGLNKKLNHLTLFIKIFFCSPGKTLEHYNYFYFSLQTYALPGNIPKTEERQLDETGMNFVKKCIEVLEARGLEEQGLYRVVGVNSKVNKLLSMGLDRRKAEKVSLDDPFEWESKTITSALKTYLRNLPEPLMTYKLHELFIDAASKYCFNTFYYVIV